MDDILQSLQLNISYVYQFVIALLFFILAKIVFFKDLKDILVLREAKTTNSLKNSEKNFTKAEELQNKYQNVLNNAYIDAQNLINEEREKENKKSSEEVAKAESEAEGFYKEQLSEYEATLEDKKKGILGEVDGLSKNLVDRILQ